MFLLILFALLVGFILLHSAQGEGHSVLQYDFASYRPMGSSIRLLLVGMLAMVWPRVVTAAKHRGAINGAAALVLNGARWRLLSWYVAAELLIGVDALSLIAVGIMR